MNKLCTSKTLKKLIPKPLADALLIFSKRETNKLIKSESYIDTKLNNFIGKIREITYKNVLSTK